MVVMRVAERDDVDRGRFHADLRQGGRCGTRLGAPLHRRRCLRADPRVQEQETARMTDQPDAHAEPPGVVVSVHVRVSTLPGEDLVGGSAGECVRDRLVVHVDVEQRHDLDVADGDGLMRHAREPITRVRSQRLGVEGVASREER